MQHVHSEHCALLCPVRNGSDTSSILRPSGSMDEVSQLICSEEDNSDFGINRLHRHTAHLLVVIVSYVILGQGS